MPLSSRLALVSVVLGLCGPVAAQTPPDTERPTRHVPKTPPTKQALDRREAQRLYAVGVRHERDSRLVEALRAFEAAERLDPDSAAIPRALSGLYVAMDRTDDATAAFKKVLRLDPDDCNGGYLYARHLRGQEKYKEAATVLTKAVASPRAADRPDLTAQMWFDLGLLHEQAKAWADAETAFRKVVDLLEHTPGLVETGRYSEEELTSQVAETLERLGRICLKAGRVEAAVSAFEAAKKKDAVRAPRLALNLAEVYREQGKPAEALEQLETYLASQPQGTEGYEMRIGIQKKLGRDREIVPSLERAAGGDPNNLALKLLLAREYRTAGRGGQALQIYTELLKIHVAPEVYRGLFEHLRDGGKAGVNQILTQLDQVIKGAMGDEKDQPGNASDARRARAMLAVLRDDPKLVRDLLPAAVLRAQDKKLNYATRSVLATLASRTKQLDVAEQLYRTCLDNPTLLGRMEHEVYGGLLRVLQYQHKHQAIIELSKTGLKHAQATNRLLFHRAMVFSYLAVNDYQGALTAADDAVKESGKEHVAGMRRIRVHALVHAGQPEKALAECQELVKEYPTGTELRDARAAMSNVLQALGRHDEAEDQLRLILKADPTDATANNDLGYLWADRNKNLADAEQLIRKAIDLDRHQRATGKTVDADDGLDNAAYVDSLGWVFFRQGKLEEARKELERALALPQGDEDPVVWDHLGDVYARLKNADKAAECWKKAVGLYDLGTRQKTDGRYKEIQEKLRQAKP